MKYVVQLTFTNPAHEHVSLRRKVETLNRIVEATSEEEAINRAANQQRALGFKIQEATIVTVEQKKPVAVINESKKEEMDDDNGQEDDDEIDDEEDDNEEDDLKEGIAADMFAARREKAQKKIADMLLKRDMEASKKERSDKRQAGTGAVAAVHRSMEREMGRAMRKESVEYIEEKLTAADPASKWIADFVKSDNPKFAGKSKKERINQALGAYYAAKRDKVEEGYDPSPAEIAKMLVKKHGAGNVSKKHILDMESDRDSNKALDHDEIMKHVKKMSEEVEQVDEVTTRVVNKEVKTEKDEKSTKAAETMINLAKSKKNKVNAKPTLDLTGSEKKYVTKV